MDSMVFFVRNIDINVVIKKPNEYVNKIQKAVGY